MILITIKRRKYYLFLDIFCVILIIGSQIGTILYFKDIKQNKLESFTGIYKECIGTGSFNTLPRCSKNVFIDENRRDEYLVVRISPHFFSFSGGIVKELFAKVHLLKFEPFEWDISIGVFMFLRFCLIKCAFHLLLQM